MLFGVAEDHDSNPIKIGLGKLKARGAKFVSINPCAPATAPSPTNGSASARAPMGCSCWRSSMSCCGPARSTSIISSATPTRTRWSSDDPGAADDGLFAAQTPMAQPLAWDRRHERRGRCRRPTDSARRLPATSRSNGRHCTPVFQLIAERYLDASLLRPTRSPARCGVPAATIRRIAAELAHAAFEQAIELPVALDRLRRAAPRDHARPPGRHARHARHLRPFERLSDLPRHSSVADAAGHHRLPGGFRYKPPYPKPAPPTAKAAGKGWRPSPIRRCRECRSALSPRRRICWSTATAGRCASTRPIPGKRRSPSHGLMHTVIHNAWRGDPYRIDTLFLYMANMAWNSSMNTAGHARDADRHRTRAATTRSPSSSIPTPIFPRPWPMPTWCCPTPPISNATTASACSTGRSAMPTGRPTPSGSRWWRPIATCGRSNRC